MGDKDKKKQQKKSASKPVQKFVLGSLSVNAWENTSKQGNKFLNFTIGKRYFDGKEWKDTTSLNASDLKNVGQLCDMAFQYAVKYDQERRNTKSSSDEDEEDDDEDEDKDEEDDS